MYLYLSFSIVIINLILHNISIGTFAYLLVSAVGFDILILILVLMKVSDNNLTQFPDI